MKSWEINHQTCDPEIGIRFGKGQAKMAIAGLLIHSAPTHLASVVKSVSMMPEVTSCGIHQGRYVVAIVEAPADLLEESVESVRAVHGVLAVRRTFLTLDDDNGS